MLSHAMGQNHALSFGAAVRAAREKRGYSQEGLADLVRCHRNYVGGIERGERNPSLEIVARIAVALGLTPNDLIFGPWRRSVER